MYPLVENRKIRMAIVRCGRISKNHFGAIEKHHEEIELVAVCEAIKEREIHDPKGNC